MPFEPRILVIGGYGYIGSALASQVTEATCTNERYDYDQYIKEDLEQFKTIILLAGHSSVKQCIDDPSGAWENNVTKFQRLLDKLSPDQTFIYASSGSVYNGCSDITENNKEFNLTTTYDLTKFTIDQLAQLSGKNYYGLRFGTVNGYSPNMRNDLMINRMYANRDTGMVQISNELIQRPILAMSDLVRAMKAIIADPTHPGIYNLKSFTGIIGSMGKAVAEDLGLEIEYVPDTPAYNFNMSTEKFEKTYNFEFTGTLQSILRSLKDETIN